MIQNHHGGVEVGLCLDTLLVCERGEGESLQLRMSSGVGSFLRLLLGEGLEQPLATTPCGRFEGSHVVPVTQGGNSLEMCVRENQLAVLARSHALVVS